MAEKTSILDQIIVIEGKEYKVADLPELKNLVSAAKIEASQAEKNKLYSEIEGVKKLNSELSAKNTTLQSELYTAQTTRPNVATPVVQPPTPQNPTLADPANPGSLPIDGPASNQYIRRDELKSYMAEAFNAVLPEMLKRTLDPLVSEITTLKQGSFEEYKQKQLASAEGTFIPELVRGTTKQEFDESLQAAKVAYSKYVTPSTNQPTTQVTTPPVTVANPNPNQPPVQQVTQPPIITPPLHNPTLIKPPDSNAPTELDKVKDMSMEEYGKKQEAIKQQLRAQYS